MNSHNFYNLIETVTRPSQVEKTKANQGSKWKAYFKTYRQKFPHPNKFVMERSPNFLNACKMWSFSITTSLRRHLTLKVYKALSTRHRILLVGCCRCNVTAGMRVRRSSFRIVFNSQYLLQIPGRGIERFQEFGEISWVAESGDPNTLPDSKRHQIQRVIGYVCNSDCVSVSCMQYAARECTRFDSITWLDGNDSDSGGPGLTDTPNCRKCAGDMEAGACQWCLSIVNYKSVHDSVRRKLWRTEELTPI